MNEKMYNLMAANVEWKYLNVKYVEMIGLIGNMLEIIGIVWKYVGKYLMEKCYYWSEIINEYYYYDKYSQNKNTAHYAIAACLSYCTENEDHYICYIKR